MPEILWLMIGLPFVIAVPLAIKGSKKQTWRGFTGWLKTFLVAVVVALAIVGVHDAFELTVNVHSPTAQGAADRLNALKRVGANLGQVAGSLRQGAEEQFGPYVSLPVGLPAVSLGVPAPAAVAPEVTLEELRRRELPLIPQEIRTMTAADLVTLGFAQTTVESKKTVIMVNGVVSPTLVSDRTEISTITEGRVITEGITATLAPTQTVTVQIFKDGTVLVSSKSITETVAGAGGWVHLVRQKAELVDKLDIGGQLGKNDPVRVQLAQTMAGMRVTLEFSQGITNPVVTYGATWAETERLVNRLLTLPVATGQNDTYQPPRSVETQVGTEHLQGLVMSYRNEYYLLLARHGVLADQIRIGKVKVDGPERKKLLEDTEALVGKVRKLKSQITIEISTHGTQYQPILLQWLNATEADLVNLVKNI